jgi:hypothetical protein
MGMFAPALHATVAPLSVLSDISPSGGEIGASQFAANFKILRFANAAGQSISPLEGEMSDRTERGAPMRSKSVASIAMNEVLS